MASVVKIFSEDDAWRLLSDLLHRKINAEDLTLDFHEATWAQFHLNFKGEVFNQTVTASMMHGIVEYQAAFYRASALLIKNDARTNRLTDQEKEDLELVFKVEEGSSDLKAKGSDQLTLLASKCVDKMSSNQILIAILSVALLFFGGQQITNYLSNEVEKTRIETNLKKEMARIEAETKRQEIVSTERRDALQIIKELSQVNKINTDLLEKAYKTSEAARRAGELNRQAVDEILRNSSKADEVTIQGSTLSQSVIREITRSQRSSSKAVVIKDKFLVVGVASEDESSFIVRLKRIGMDEIIIATLDDPLLSAKHHKAIKQAEWSRQPVMVHITARQVGDEFKDAKILQAYTPRKR